MALWWKKYTKKIVNAFSVSQTGKQFQMYVWNQNQEERVIRTGIADYSDAKAFAHQLLQHGSADFVGIRKTIVKDNDDRYWLSVLTLSNGNVVEQEIE